MYFVQALLPIYVATMPGRRIVITGANRGIGFATAKLLIEEGNTVWGACRTPDAAEELAALNPAGILKLDIGDEQSITDFAAALAAETDAIDTLMNNAGITARELGVDRSKQGAFLATSEVVLEQIRVNALGPMLITQAVQPLLHAGTDPAVLNVSSQLGSMVVGAKMPFDVGYNSSKAVMNMITSMSAATDKEVAFVAVHPGYVRTDMSGPKAAIDPEESAAGIASILSNLTLENSGRFLSWDGSEHPW